MVPTTAQLRAWVSDARARSLELIEDLSADQLEVPLLPTVNPFVWELCHLVYFQEFWVLRRTAGQDPWRPEVDRLFDSAAVEHESRWRLPCPSRAEAFEYARDVERRVLGLLEQEPSPELAYRVHYSVMHEDEHAEALTYTRQALGLPPPRLDLPRARERRAGPVHAVDVPISGGAFELGARPGAGFCFDNEKWAHPVEVDAFAIDPVCVSEGRFAAFVEDGGYRRGELWDAVGGAWLAASGAELPLYWRRAGDGYERRRFDRWIPVERDPMHSPAMVHVNHHEARAFCAWADRRLPTEAEWELAACGSGAKRLQPWGDEPAGPGRASVDFAALGPVDPCACPEGDTPEGVRQLLGNVWEWTDTTFAPYPGFEPDMYEQYSQTMFATRKVLRGGSFATRGRLVRSTFRNYFQPSRRDVFAGFRTCAPRS